MSLKACDSINLITNNKNSQMQALEENRPIIDLDFSAERYERPVELCDTDFFGGRSIGFNDSTKVFPDNKFFEGKKKSELAGFYLTKIEWGVAEETNYI